MTLPRTSAHPARYSALAALVVLPAFAACSDASPSEPIDEAVVLAPMEALGKRLFEDENLSIRKNQSCASCHDPAWGFKGSAGSSRGGVFEGSIPGRFGERVPQSAAYAAFAPVFGWSEAVEGYLGGNFWDGRATGATLGSPTAEQARGPFLNPVEQALPDLACVVHRVSTSAYAGLYREVWNEDLAGIAFTADADARCAEEGTTLALSSDDRARATEAYDRIARSIAAFEASAEVSPFSSKFDAWLRGQAQLTHEERMGLMLFQGPARCAVCHTITGPRPLFTDFSYHNVGTPRNPANPAEQGDPAFVDLGLGGPSGAAPGAAQEGRVRTPTLRNVDRRASSGAVKPFMHNGAFTTLKEVVRYYNTRDVLPRCAADAPRDAWGASCWPEPSVPANLNTRDMGDLGLNAFQEDAIVSFLRTLTDGYPGG